MAINRRGIVRGSLLAAGGALAGAGAVVGAEKFGERYPLPYYDGYAAAIHADRRTPPRHGQTPVVWNVHTTKRLIALTFDDGPMPQWTPDVLSILDEQKVRATFFLIGRNVRDHGNLLAGHSRHEYGNHTWAHRDLGRMDYAAAYAALHRAHEAIAGSTGQEPRVFRPPYGHLGGSSLLAAADLGYPTVLWNLQMVESDYRTRPDALVDYIVETATPGTVVLAHDTGPDDRLIAIRRLPAMIQKLSAKGYEFVTVSELLAEGA